MPIPKKRKNESKSEFIDRCMGDEVMNDEFANTQQRYATMAGTPELSYRCATKICNTDVLYRSL